MMAKHVPLVSVLRGPLRESMHSGRVAVVHSSGALVASAGDPKDPMFARSTAKLLQVIPVLVSGASERFGLEDQDIAVACASHNGEPVHVEAVTKLLEKAGISQDQLQCGPHAPYHKPTAVRMREHGTPFTSLHNNCSGKHAAMLTLSAFLGAKDENYMDPSHPVQQYMLKTVAAMSGEEAADIPLGIDGCGVPVFAMPLQKLALAYARLGRPDSLPEGYAAACGRILRALRSHPHLLAGDDRFDTALIRATGGRLIGKMGAEGVFAVTVPDEGLGIAVKVEDGSLRALYPAVVEALRQLQLLSGREYEALAGFHSPLLHNWRGDAVGRIEPCFTLDREACG
ncbi:asparaginase [Paenibacillus turpanensis]|uniref:asparaginase n=1 Tax=Paenibacillus turpanensis TaxID=2689078 RepID=UPI00140DCB5E|nr:asparaginase [Paenibacillus turpanensis]